MAWHDHIKTERLASAVTGMGKVGRAYLEDRDVRVGDCGLTTDELHDIFGMVWMMDMDSDMEEAR